MFAKTKKFPVFKQTDRFDCGPACLKMICKYYGRDFNIEELRLLCKITPDGVIAKNLLHAMESLGLSALPASIDFETLKKAFHETATMKYITKDGYKEVNALEFFSGMDASKPKQNRKTRIADITISGHAANARLEIDYPTFTFIDYMNLLKIDGEWKVVNKIFYRKAD